MVRFWGKLCIEFGLWSDRSVPVVYRHDQSIVRHCPLTRAHATIVQTISQTLPSGQTVVRPLSRPSCHKSVSISYPPPDGRWLMWHWPFVIEYPRKKEATNHPTVRKEERSFREERNSKSHQGLTKSYYNYNNINSRVSRTMYFGSHHATSVRRKWLNQSALKPGKTECGKIYLVRPYLPL